MEYSPAKEIENDPARYQLQQSKTLFARASKYYGSKNIKYSQTNFSGSQIFGDLHDDRCRNRVAIMPITGNNRNCITAITRDTTFGTEKREKR